MGLSVNFESTDEQELPVFDGGETGCGELLLDLLVFMRRQPAGQTVVVRALDPGAPNEIPAWCRLTEHELQTADHPRYTIRKPKTQH